MGFHFYNKYLFGFEFPGFEGNKSCKKGTGGTAKPPPKEKDLAEQTFRHNLPANSEKMFIFATNLYE